MGEPYPMGKKLVFNIFCILGHPNAQVVGMTRLLLATGLSWYSSTFTYCLRLMGMVLRPEIFLNRQLKGEGHTLPLKQIELILGPQHFFWE